MMPLEAPTKVEVICRALFVREGLMCFACVAGTTGVPLMDVTACMEQPGMAGLTFQRGVFFSCTGEDLWCVEHRAPGP